MTIEKIEDLISLYTSSRIDDALNSMRGIADHSNKSKEKYVRLMEAIKQYKEQK